MRATAGVGHRALTRELVAHVNQLLNIDSHDAQALTIGQIRAAVRRCAESDGIVFHEDDPGDEAFIVTPRWNSWKNFDAHMHGWLVDMDDDRTYTLAIVRAAVSDSPASHWFVVAVTLDAPLHEPDPRTPDFLPSFLQFS